ncbi:MAG: oligosaccharide flippase family protein, partial [Pyrinomonadaceae bacterium]
MAEALQKGGSMAVRAFWLMLAKSLAFVLSFALPLLLVRRLDQTQFGLYKQAFLVVGTAISMLPLGFSMSAFYFLPREPERQPAVVFNILLFSLFVGGLACSAFFLRPTLLNALVDSSELVAYAPLIGLVILLWIGSAPLEYVAVAHQETKLATAFIIGAQLTRTA